MIPLCDVTVPQFFYCKNALTENSLYLMILRQNVIKIALFPRTFVKIYIVPFIKTVRLYQ